MEEFARGLSAEDLARTTSYGWTISALLAHLAYWDQRMLVILHRWKEHGLDRSPVDAQAVNDALLPLCMALESEAAIDLCLSSAEAIDAELEALSPALFDGIQAHVEATSTQFRMNRSLHRNDHLQDMEAVLG
jgi:hypothetical protein